TALDLQFEVITTYLNDGGKSPRRAKNGNAHAYLGAPYGVYETADGYVALAMTDLNKLGKQIGLTNIANYYAEYQFDCRDEIMDQLRSLFIKKTTQEWLNILELDDIWCADVKDYQ